jgi:hypothetical protein
MKQSAAMIFLAFDLGAQSFETRAKVSSNACLRALTLAMSLVHVSDYNILPQPFSHHHDFVPRMRHEIVARAINTPQRYK